MPKQPNHIPNPFEYRDELKKLEAIRQKDLAFKKRLQAIIEQDQPPSDPMSWEYHIWQRHRNPLRMKGR